MPTLIVDPDGRRQACPVVGAALSIGSDPTNGLVIDWDLSVRRYHCRLTRDGVGYRVEDLGGGTRVDGQPVSTAPLRHGQLLLVGQVRVRYELDPEERPTYGLYAVAGAREGSVAIFNATIEIGRDPASDLVLDGVQVSARHCTLTLSPLGCELRDLGSTNGTRVDGARVQTCWLGLGQTLQIGEHEMLLQTVPLPAEPAPAEAASPPADAPAPWRPLLDLALAGALSLALWLGVLHLIVAPLLRPGPGPAPPPAGEIPLGDTGPDGLPRHYRLVARGSWAVTLSAGPRRQLVIEGGGGPGRSFAVELREAEAPGRGRALSLVASATGARALASLYATYLDPAGEPLGRVYGPETTLGRRTVLKHRFGPLTGAATMRLGVLLSGAVQQVRLGPFRRSAAAGSELGPAAMSTPWGRLRVTPLGELYLDTPSAPLARVELCTLAQGERVATSRHVERPVLTDDEPGRVRLTAGSVGPHGRRGRLQLEASQDEVQTLVMLQGTPHTHWRLSWPGRAPRVVLGYRGQSVAARGGRRLLDEMAVHAGALLTLSFEPPVYLEETARDGAGAVWSLRLAERGPRATLQVTAGSRRAVRERIRLGREIERAQVGGEYGEVLRLMARRHALGPLDDALRRIEASARAQARLATARALAQSGPEGLRALDETLHAMVGTAHAERLEAELVRRLLFDTTSARRAELATTLLNEARWHLAYDRLALARSALGLVVTLLPEEAPDRLAAEELLLRMP